MKRFARSLAQLAFFACLVMPAEMLLGQEKKSNETGEQAVATAAPHDLLLKAIARLDGVSTIQAEMTERVELFGKAIVAKGSYRKGAGELLMHLELDIDMSAFVHGALRNNSTLIMNCDGATLITTREVLGQQENVEINVKEALSRLSKEKEHLRRPILDLMGLFSMSQLLRGVDDTMEPKDWTRLEKLEASFEASQDRKVYVLQGRWKAALTQPLTSLPPAAGRPATKADGKPAVPADIPDVYPSHVVLYLDRDTGFPYRIEYWHRSADGKKNRRIILLEWTNPILDAPIPEEDFRPVTTPSDVVPQTDDWVTLVQRADAEGIEPLEEVGKKRTSILPLVIPELQEENTP